MKEAHVEKWNPAKQQPAWEYQDRLLKMKTSLITSQLKVTQMISAIRKPRYRTRKILLVCEHLLYLKTITFL